jgi:sulfhydrogenase subunit delta
MKPRIAVFKFASCDGCQLQFLNAADELLKLTDLAEIAYFLEARSRAREGPYDIAFVEGSITTADDARRIIMVREQSRYLITIGACATAGGI